jgi:hypothetical protein
MSGAGKLAAGMEVVSSDGETLGRVKEIASSGQYFRVDCPMAPDYYVPMQEVATTSDGRVRLRVSRAMAANMGWEVRPEEA